ncbi:hypothetical protein [Kitasatospora sp. NPDC092286]|uniref:hypothetical protein n=1 Tax=Kitasatospora sp. NPDC092286 TaxID=3364087 RepID=UPI0038298CF5
MEPNEPPDAERSAEAEARVELLRAITDEVHALGGYPGQHHRALVELAHAYALVTDGRGAAATSSPEQQL